MEIDSGAYAGGAGNLRRLCAMRWFVIAGQLVVIAGAQPLLDIDLPATPMLSVVGLLAAFNTVTLMRLRREVPVTDAELFVQLCADVTGITVLLFFSGGAANPFVSLYLLPVTVAAAVLPDRHAWALAALAIAAYSMLNYLYVPLAISNPARATQLHLAGMWLIFAASTGLITWFVARMTAAIRLRDRELAAAREEALRNERVVALGSLAAGAAHELGTPLATMAVIAGELAHKPGLPPEATDDMKLLAEQIAYCKSILTTLSGKAGQARAEGGRALSLDAWLGEVLARWRALRPLASARADLRGSEPPPVVLGDATLEQALLNLLDNAADASPGDVTVEARWDRDWLRVQVGDRGPGMDARVLRDGGRSCITTRPGGAGIGLFLARATIERLGGSIALESGAGGSLVRLELPIQRIGVKRP